MYSYSYSQSKNYLCIEDKNLSLHIYGKQAWILHSMYILSLHNSHSALQMSYLYTSNNILKCDRFDNYYQ